jgi:hypothetical protein
MIPSAPLFTMSGYSAFSCLAICTSDKEFFKGKSVSFPVSPFLLELTQYIECRGSQVYTATWALRTAAAGRRNQGQVAGNARGRPAHVMRLAPAGWKAERLKASEPIHLFHEKTASVHGHPSDFTLETNRRENHSNQFR